LSLEDVTAIAARRRTVEISAAARARIGRGREVTEALLSRGQRVYGLTTGVGALKRVPVAEAEQVDFNRLLLLSHRTGTGPAVADVSALLDRFDEAAALTFEGMLGNVEALDPEVASARPVPGIADAVDRMRALLAGGRLLEGELHRHLQDPLTMRVVPQTHSA